MKIFDRYIIVSFLRNYVLSFLVLVGLYIALDMVFNFDELARAATSGDAAGAGNAGGSFILKALGIILTIGDYYFFQSFAFFVQLSGIIPVVAAAFTLIRLMRCNELTALLAAGVPMLRIAAPLVVAGIVMSALLVVDQELIIPRISSKLIREHDEIGQRRGQSYPIKALEDSAGSLLMAGRFDPEGEDSFGKTQPPMMTEVDVVEFNKDREPIAHIQAREATYNAKGRLWHLKSATRQTGLRPNDPITTSPVTEWKTDLGPTEIAVHKRSRSVEFLSSSQLSDMIQHPRNYGTVPLLRVKHWRFVQPITNILLLVLAIPCILTREPNALRATAARTVLMTGACLTLVFVSHQFAGKPPSESAAWYWPALMLWIPIFVFGPIAAYKLERLKT